MQKKEETMPDNPELKKLFDEDQSERKQFIEGSLDNKTLFNNDIVRQKQVQKMIEHHTINTGLDYYYAAMFFHHGQTKKDIQRAKKLVKKSLYKGEMKAKWLTAATIDRLLIFSNKPQTYGTQSYYDGNEHKLKLHPYDPKTTDEQRQAMDVPKLEDLIKELENTSKYLKPRS